MDAPRRRRPAEIARAGIRAATRLACDQPEPCASRVASSRCRTSRSTARYGSRAPPARARSSGMASVIDRSSRSASTSRRYRSAARQRAEQHATRVTSGVTCGLPSRSPPIHDPKRIGAASSGSGRPVVRRSAASSDRQVARQGVPDCLLEDSRPLVTSSSGVGLSRPDLFRFPRRGDFTAQLLDRLRALRHGQVRAIEPHQRVRDVQVLVNQRAPGDLRRMRREHELDPQRARSLVKCLRRHTAGDQPRKGLFARRRLRAG